MTKKIGFSWCLTGVALVVFGCHSTPKRKAEIPTEFPAADATTPIAATGPWQSQTFFHQPEFRQGAGPVDAGDPPDFIATDSGLRYRVLRDAGGKKPTRDSTVSVNYRGWLHSGKVFDSSYERGKPTTFPLDGVIAGWTEGMQLVGEGGMIELWIPSKLGYGERGSPGSIPPHSHLHFIVELVDVD
ncbi:FKBP-type peptidyl-prolyl cis-trans isomerase [Rhodopirellula sp. MGV]|uniref:FKBP-type peptidyl-prolyl cis-trans isomerase n=1 Tax=Rhodopirellula sp. MGV TaxID=2023130 RepID=UPI000B970CFC|nr:FKBP-type peptidyl-prolyl cis-trans isomerase [Rhodopirellula sp. MGV]OYP34340.1 peptidylprolyl isomerase [Rhodopirellula sp. MGV]PNY35258.1 FKBP-type peptidyl-prolyl cis-trans isomerase [Rhodopirellula baltica]